MEAIRIDQGRPNDDMSVVVLRVSHGLRNKFAG